jgi:hypothetical protein
MVGGQVCGLPDELTGLVDLASNKLASQALLAESNVGSNVR